MFGGLGSKENTTESACSLANDKLTAGVDISQVEFLCLSNQLYALWNNSSGTTKAEVEVDLEDRTVIASDIAELRKDTTHLSLSGCKSTVWRKLGAMINELPELSLLGLYMCDSGDAFV